MKAYTMASALAASALAGIAIAAASAAPGRPGDSREAATALSAAPATQRGAGPSYRAAGARAAAAQRAAAVPLPAGGTFNGVQWERGGDAIRPTDIEGVLEYNAACQWLRAWRDGRDGALALEVLARVPSWPFVRGTDSGAFLTQVAADAAAGGGQQATAMLADCDASHSREVEYATSLGLTASR